MQVPRGRLPTAAFALVSCLALSVQALGAESDSALVAGSEVPVVRVTAPRVQPEMPHPGSRTVLDRAWLDHMDPIDLSRALMPVAGLRVLQAGDGISQMISIRGLTANRVAVLVDGRALNTAQGGGVDLEPIDLQNVESVEITRGAVGAIYGPDALGGAVNVVRKENRTPGGSARILAGTGDRAKLNLGYGVGRGRWNLDAAFRTETFSPILNDRRVRSDGKGGRARFSLHPRWADFVEAGTEYREDRRDVPGTRDFPTPGANRKDRYRELTLSARGVALSGLPGTIDFNLSTSAMERRYRDLENPLGPASDHHDNRRSRFATSWRAAGARESLEARVEAVRDKLESTASGRVERDRAAYGVHVSQGFGNWSVSTAVRADAVEHFAPRATARWSISRTLHENADGDRSVMLRGGGGTSFRTPTFDDLFWPARAGAVGNPDLDPERSRDFEIGLEGQAPATRFQLNGFHSEIRDLIQWTPGPDGLWRPHNVSRARIRGAELEGSAGGRLFRVPVRVDAAISWLDPIDTTGDRITGGKQLIGRARLAGFGEASVGRGRWSLAAGVRAVGRTPLTNANTKWSKAYAVTHCRVRWQASSLIRFELEGNNLLSTDYEDIRGYATPGREILMGIRLDPRKHS